MKISCRTTILIVFVLVCVSVLSGCALLQLPGQVIGGTFSLLGKMLGIVNQVPKPPPWIFL